MTTHARRRWLRYSLRALMLLVTAIALWRGYAWNRDWIRQRQEALSNGRFFSRDPPAEWPQIALRLAPELPRTTPRAPGLLWLFGERGHAIVGMKVGDGPQRQLTSAEQAELDHLIALFPESSHHPILWRDVPVRRSFRVTVPVQARKELWYDNHGFVYD